jgi:hypothetical protein
MDSYDSDHHVRPPCYFCGRALHVHEGEHYCPRCTAWTLTNPPAWVGALDGEPWGPLDDFIEDKLFDLRLDRPAVLDHQPAAGRSFSTRSGPVPCPGGQNARAGRTPPTSGRRSADG